MQFSKLRLSGFKSFVDDTELEIKQGLTGVVGPNGCGKSNLVEALKWVMGETSAKQMRGGEMDDIIFAGSRNRPARNIAEVSLALNNSQRTAPAQFNERDELEVSRKIEREKGSTYRVNKKEVRARDVHLLFADAASGARSTALVSQGQIGEVVSAKPSERRKLLEEAAGISGLYSRRHEAELRLRGAETNLERLQDIIITLEAQLLALKKQVRQATRYRNLNDHIRKAEATMFQILWASALCEKERNTKILTQAELGVTDMTVLASAASVQQAAAAEQLPELREKEAGAAATLQRFNLARENLEEEEARLKMQEIDCKKRLLQVNQDIDRESTLLADATAAIQNLNSENNRINSLGKDQNTNVLNASERLKVVKSEYKEQEGIFDDLNRKIAAQEAQHNDYGRRRSEIETRLDRLRTNEEKVKEELNQLQKDSITRTTIETAENKLINAQTSLEKAREYTENSVIKKDHAGRMLHEAQEKQQNILLKSSKLEAEVHALSEILEISDPDLWPPIIDAITVEAGLERALGAALGEDLNAATDESAPIHWRQLPNNTPKPSLPVGAEPLSEFVKGPEALVSRLSQIGVVSNKEAGLGLVSKLKQGQRLVTRDGAFWRWDGLSSAAEAPTTAAIRLQQRNRLADARIDLERIDKENNTARSDLAMAQEKVKQTTENEKIARRSVREAEIQRDKIQNEVTNLRRDTLENETKISTRKDNLTVISADFIEAKKAFDEIIKSEIKLVDIENGKNQVNLHRASVAQKRNNLVEAQTYFDTLQNQEEERKNRLQAIKSQITNWEARREDAEIQIKERKERKSLLEAEQKRLVQKPTEIRDRHTKILDKIQEAELYRKKTSDELVKAETSLKNSDRNLREAESKLASAREHRVKAQANIEQTQQVTESLSERLAERINCKPEELNALSGIESDSDLPELSIAEKKVERLLRERGNMGPVNLLAETEAADLTEQIQTLNQEREDLINAISKLRTGINELNREGRQRLVESFEEVNKHFQDLFIRLFGGGRAHLELIESDDPLEAGLEIMASPPGKRLQVLSLLSGGEQALTALSLLFAVFMRNPAPICVLDEVDAPLDDANVDRFCTLVSEMAKKLSTRFLVITHHRMTMARMDRLFGVTMGEQGVSQLVSVDLGEAIELREIA